MKRPIYEFRIRRKHRITTAVMKEKTDRILTTLARKQHNGLIPLQAKSISEIINDKSFGYEENKNKTHTRGGEKENDHDKGRMLQRLFRRHTEREEEQHGRVLEEKRNTEERRITTQEVKKESK